MKINFQYALTLNEYWLAYRNDNNNGAKAQDCGNGDKIGRLQTRLTIQCILKTLEANNIIIYSQAKAEKINKINFEKIKYCFRMYAQIE